MAASQSGTLRASLPVVPAALAVTAIWGFNFVVIAVGLKGVPPLLLAALRFVLSALPAVFFVPFPATKPRWVVLYGVLLGVGQFGFLFSGMKLGVPAGIASIVLQVQAFFTALLAAIFHGEKLRKRNFFGMALAFSGLAIIAFVGQGGASAGGLIPPLGLIFVVLGGLMWAGANVVVKFAGPVDALSLVVWSSLFSPLPLLALSLGFEGPAAIRETLARFSLVSAGAVAYQAFAATVFAYKVWNRLIAARGAAAVAPFSLLVPVFGILSASLFLGEDLSAADLWAALLILGGLVIHVAGDRVARWFRKARI